MNKNITMRNTERTNTTKATTDTKSTLKKHIKYGDDEVIIPLRNNSDPSVYDAIISPNKIHANGMNGHERFFSVPKDAEKAASVLFNYLKNFIGKNVCIALWINGREKNEKCGTLTDVGYDYLSIKSNRSNRLIIISMDKVKYISVFCI